jgi:hypothetical protein
MLCFIGLLSVVQGHDLATSGSLCGSSHIGCLAAAGAASTASRLDMASGEGTQK